MSVLQHGVNDLATKAPEIAKQWHPTKNGDLRPEDAAVCSNKKVWWICDKGHGWRASGKVRTRGHGCPVCANKLILVGVNDLSTTHPLLAAQWHPTKNGDLTPDSVTVGSCKKVWWLGPCGHEWQAGIASRDAGCGCPVCNGKVALFGFNDLESQFPDIAKQWHPTKNEKIRPDAVTAYSNKKVWWICDKGHEWEAAIAPRTKRGTGCPVCTGRKVLPGFNDLATLEPKVAKEWHPTLNNDLTPMMVTRGSKKRVWWICPFGHVWKSVIFSRTREKRSGCPICAKLN